MSRIPAALEANGPLPAVALSIIHDLRNPLAAIRAGSEMLVRAGLNERQAQQIARNVHGAAARMMELLEELLRQYRGDSGAAEVSDVGELAAHAIERVAPLAESQSVTITLEIPEGLNVRVDRTCIRRVLVNLLVNAVEAMPEGGAIHVSAVPEPGGTRISVCDSGPGISPEIHDRLFEPFATAGKSTGMGLGLAFARQAVEEHGGEIRANSTHLGTCFEVRLPAAEFELAAVSG